MLHDLAALTLITMVMMHVYFALRPEKWSFTRSMIRGWITRDEYSEHHDPETVAGRLMTTTIPIPRAVLDRRIDAIESGYEFMLAYAAQGRDTDKGAAAGRNVREFLEAMDAALDGLGAAVTACARSVDADLESQAAAVFRCAGRGCACGSRCGAARALASRHQLATHRQSQCVDSSARAADGSVRRRRKLENSLENERLNRNRLEGSRAAVACRARPE